MIFRYIFTYTTIVIVLLIIVLPIALCASALIGTYTTISKFCGMLYGVSKEFFKLAKDSLDQAKIKRLLTKVIKENTIDV